MLSYPAVFFTDYYGTMIIAKVCSELGLHVSADFTLHLILEIAAFVMKNPNGFCH